MKQSFWIAAAAVLEKEGTIPAQLVQRWDECVSESNNPQIIEKILAAAFPEMQHMLLDELCNVAAALLDKSLNSDSQNIVGHPTEFLEPLRASFHARPGLFIFAAEKIKLWLCSSSQQQQQQQRAYSRAVEILLWLAEVATTTSENQSISPAFTSFANLLSKVQQNSSPQQPPESLLTTLLRYFQTFSIGTKLQTTKLIGLCSQNSHSSAFYTCWQALENILCSERNEEVLCITACALFESIASHASTNNFIVSDTNYQLRATTAIENGLACPLPSIQFPAAVAAGKILQQQKHRQRQRQQFWNEGLVERVAAAAEHAYCIQKDRVGAWGAWQPDTEAGVAGAAHTVLHVPPSRKLTAQHILAVLEIVHKEYHPINKES